jgi:hypothetical protein
MLQILLSRAGTAPIDLVDVYLDPFDQGNADSPLADRFQ